MKNYIKPTFALAGLSPMSLTPSCNLAEIDIDNLDWFFNGEDWSKAFVDSGDGCQEDSGYEAYCKLHYAEKWDVPTVFNSF